MNKYRFGFVIVLLILVLFPFCEKTSINIGPDPFEMYCDSLEALGIIDDYEFPILPGTPEYVALTPAQRDSVFQIPDTILKTMCTPGLIETCFNYPFLWHYRLWDYYVRWWDVLTDRFNGVACLQERSDAPRKMLTQYLEFNEYPYSDTITWSSVKLVIGAKLAFIELFLSQKDVINALSSTEKHLLGVRANHFWQEKIDNYHIEFSLHPGRTCFLMGRLMYYDNYGPFIAQVSDNMDLGSFIKYGSEVFKYDESWEAILLHFDNYLDSL